MEPEISPESYQDIVFDIVNYGLDIRTSRQAHEYLQHHLSLMDHEKAEGKPKGPVIWFAYLRILEYLYETRELLKQKEAAKSEGYLWTPVEPRTIL